MADQAQPTLLDRARATPSRRCHSNPNAQLAELAVAWANGEITDTQAAAAVGGTVGSIGSKMGYTIRRAVGAGLVRVLTRVEMGGRNKAR